MKFMKLVIEIPEAAYNRFCDRYFDRSEVEEAIEAITDGTPLEEDERVQELEEFAHFVAKSVTSDDFESDIGFYTEIFCRRLHDLGIIKQNKDEWIYGEE